MQVQSQFDHAYYSARLAKNRHMAASTSDPILRSLHQDLAAMYERILEEFNANAEVPESRATGTITHPRAAA